MTPEKSPTSPDFRDLVATFARIGVLSFGGAAGQIAMMHRVVVEEKRWIDERRYLDALNYCMLLPGPEAQQLATYLGWLTHGVRGGLAAGILFVVPGALIMLGLSFLYVLGGDLALVEGIFYGIKAAVLAIVAQALIKIARRGLKTPVLYALAMAAFLALTLTTISFPIVVIGAGVIGAAFAIGAPALIGLGATSVDAPLPARPGRTRAAFIAALWCLAAWWAPVALAVALLGAQHVLVDIGLFFSKLAVITFGGAYAVLAYLAQEGVARGWASAREMIDGLGLAETTPGPTILVNQFVAFLGAMRASGDLPPLVVATLGAMMATWTTFAPSFLWIFAGAPFLETIRRDRRLAGALTGITSAVVGVIASLALWFALHVVFRAVEETSSGVFRFWTVDLGSIDPVALGLVGLAFLLVFPLKRGIIEVVAVLGAAGAAATMLAA